MNNRIGKLIRLLGSDRLGEVAAAVAAIMRQLQAAGKDIHALAEVVERSPLIPGQMPPTPSDDGRPWSAIQEWCLARDEHLAPRELAFLIDIMRWRGNLTPRQHEWLLAIERRIRKHQRT